MTEPAPPFLGTHADTEARATAEAWADVAAGQLVPHEKVAEWLRSWGTPNELPCPLPEIDEEVEARAIAEARADYVAGRFVPHERVREWLLKLAKGENVPPPSA